MKNKARVYDLCWKYHRLWHKSMRKGFDDKIHDQVNSTAEKILIEVESFDNLNNNFLVNDIRALFNWSPLDINIFTQTKKSFSQIKKNDVVSFVNSYIFTEPEDFEFFFKFGFSAEFRTGYQLGNGIFYSVDKLPKNIRSFIVGHMPYEHQKDHFSTITKKNWVKIRKRDAYMKIVVKSIGIEKAKQKAFSQLQKNYNIYKLVAGIQIRGKQNPESKFYYCMHATKQKISSISEGYTNKEFIFKSKFYNKQIKSINKIFNKKIPTELEQRILNAIDMHGLIEQDTPLYVRFTLCIMGLESLLLGKGDRDYLGHKMAEKIAFLLADVKWWVGEIYDIPYYKFATINDVFLQKHLFDSRLRLQRKIKEFYTKRSNFAHSGISNKGKLITEDDYGWAVNFLRWSIETLMPKTKKFNRVSKDNKNDLKYLDYYFEQLRYA